MEITDEMVDRAAEALWDAREDRDPSRTYCDDCADDRCREIGGCADPDERWAPVIARGAYSASVREQRQEARAALEAALLEQSSS